MANVVRSCSAASRMLGMASLAAAAAAGISTECAFAIASFDDASIHSCSIQCSAYVGIKVKEKLLSIEECPQHYHNKLRLDLAPGGLAVLQPSAWGSSDPLLSQNLQLHLPMQGSICGKHTLRPGQWYNALSHAGMWPIYCRSERRSWELTCGM